MQAATQDAQQDATATAARTEPAPFDFDALGDTRVHEFTPKDPRTGQPVHGVVFGIAGEDTDEFRAALDFATQEQAARLQRDPDAPISQRQFTVDLLTKAVLWWRGVNWGARGALECTDANKAELFGKRAWLTDQLRTFTNDRAKKLGKS